MNSVPPDLDAPSLLDPEDWAGYREQAHSALDAALDFVQQQPGEAVWQALPDAARVTDAELPEEGVDPAVLIAELEQRVLPYTLGNTHPRFWGWVHGSGTPGGVIAQLMMGAINANMGGREHAPIYLERQLLTWLRQLFEFPPQATGLICSGTSTATLLALSIARQRRVGAQVRRLGNAMAPGLVAYSSCEAHVSVVKAMELIGLGSEALRSVPVAADFAMDTAALEATIQQDMAAGAMPFAVVSCVGTVNTGAIDELASINEICRRYQLWHHVDGAFGALCMLAPQLRKRLQGIELADSIALDFHKWLHVTYSVGCLLVRDGEQHRASFASPQSYLATSGQGMAAGAPWPNEYGIELSRGFGALAVWFQLKEHGSKRLGAAIYRNCLQAQWLGTAVAAVTELELLAPVTLNIVCFRYTGSGLGPAQLQALNRLLVVELQSRGIAAPSSTEVAGVAAIRVAITNHRTRKADLQALLAAVLELAVELLPGL